MAGTLALGLAFVLLLAWDLWSIKADLDAGRERLDGLTLDAAASVGITGLADEAAGHLRDAADRTRSSVPLRLLSLVPYVDDQVDGIRRMAAVAGDMGDAGAAAAHRIDRRLEAAGEPAGRIALLDAALAEIGRVEATIGEVDLGAAGGLLPPLRDAHDDLAEALVDARSKLDDGRALIEPVREMLEGPSSLLLLAANNAEMTGGAGMALSAGILTFAKGDFELSEVVRAGDLRLPDSVPIPDHIQELYAPTGVGIDLRSSTRSPDLATMAPIALDIMARHGADDLDGVLVVDAVALASLMELSGPVTVDGTTITPENALEEVLHNSYRTFASHEERTERVSYQGDIAQAVFEALTESDVAGIDLARTLLTASEGRHVMLWSQQAALQDVWTELGVTGELDPLGLMISFQNYGADKLDWYLRPSAALDVALLPSGDYRATLTMTMPVPSLAEMPGATPYILGPSPAAHGVFLTVHLPREAYDITTPDRGAFRTVGEEPPMQVRSFLADVPLGSTFERTIEFSLPRDVSALVLLPSARAEPLDLTVDGVATVDDAVPRAITWLAAHPPGAGADAPSPWVRIPVLLGLLGTLAATATVALTAARHKALAGPLPSFVPAAAASALAFFAVAAVVAMALAWSSPRL